MMMRIYTRTSLIVLGVFFPLVSFAIPSIGEAAENILVPTEILTKLVLLTCYILGAIFIFMAFAQYRVHRQSPKLIPLTTPILLFILGVICALIPLSSKIFGETFSAVERSDIPKTGDGESLLPLPETLPRGPVLPMPNRSENQNQTAPPPPPPPPSSPSSSSEDVNSGHWTNDPRYNP